MVTVIDVPNHFTNNTALSYVILTNVDTTVGEKEQQNKERFQDIVSRRNLYFEVQSCLASMNKSVMSSLKEFPTKSEVSDHLMKEFMGEDS